jgi:predicted nucleic acid-binding protein
MPSRVIFDTNAYSHLFRGNTDCALVLQMSPRIGIPVIVMAELLSGFERGNRYAQNVERLEQFLELPRVDLIFPDQETAFAYSRVNAQLEKLGQPIPTNDIWIAALTMQHNDVLLTFDAHFSRVNGLRFGVNATQLGLL